MNIVYICWQNDNTILGVASSEEKAQEMCSELGEAYMSIRLDEVERENIDTTELCIHHVKEGFKTYDECIELGYTFRR